MTEPSARGESIALLQSFGARQTLACNHIFQEGYLTMPSLESFQEMAVSLLPPEVMADNNAAFVVMVAIMLPLAILMAIGSGRRLLWDCFETVVASAIVLVLLGILLALPAGAQLLLAHCSILLITLRSLQCQQLKLPKKFRRPMKNGSAVPRTT